MDEKRLYILAVLLLGLVTVPFSVEAQQKDAFKKEHFINNTDTLHYRVLFPNNFSEKKEYPLVLFLHGAGERGNNNESQLIHGSDIFLNSRENFPAIVVFPQAQKTIIGQM